MGEKNRERFSQAYRLFLPPPQDAHLFLKAWNMVKDNSYITIQSFMINDLKLKGNELLIYAIIFGFSQDGENHYTGSLSYLADWTNSTKQGVIKNLKSLIDKGFIVKVEKIINNIKFCEYYATKFNMGKQSLTGYSTEFNGGIKKSLPDNITDNIEDNLVNTPQQEKELSVDYGDKIKIGTDFKIAYSDEYFYPYRHATEKVKSSLERWLIKNKLGAVVDKNFICLQIGNFAKKQGCYNSLFGENEGGK
jgi:hypothetical protein